MSRFGIDMEESCPIFKGFRTILESDSNFVLTISVIKISYFSSFYRLLELVFASTMVGGHPNFVIAEFGNPEDYESVGRQKFYFFMIFLMFC